MATFKKCPGFRVPLFKDIVTESVISAEAKGHAAEQCHKWATIGVLYRNHIYPRVIAKITIT